MRLDVDNIPSVGDLAVVRPSAVVGMGLDDVSLVAEDGLVGRRRVHDHCIWAVAEYRAFVNCQPDPSGQSFILVGRTIFLL